MEMGEMLQFVTNGGFSIVVALYMLLVNNKTMKENTESNLKMIAMLEKVLERVS